MKGYIDLTLMIQEYNINGANAQEVESMAKATCTVKMCDMNKKIATKVFQMLNGNDVWLKETPIGTFIVTDIEPKDLIYPEGWYYAKGTFRNKHTSTTGSYDEIPMVKNSMVSWKDFANYCTLD